MLTRTDLEILLPEYLNFHSEVKKLTRFCTAGHRFATVCLKREAERHPLILHPDWAGILELSPISGIYNRGSLRNADLTDFPEVMKDGRLQKQGFHFDVDDEAALASLFGYAFPPKGDPLSEIEAISSSLASVGPTTRKAIIDARLKQGVFRRRLLREWHGACAVTGVDVPALLRASHIKPFVECTPKECLAVDNGLLLIATLDAAFDAWLISFDQNGLLLTSPKTPHALLGISPGASLRRPPTLAQCSFLEEHRSRARL